MVKGVVLNMEFLINNWFLLIIAIAVIACISYCIYVFINRPTNEQLSKVKEWLLFGVAQAEKELGSGTGQIKLRYVYDMFILRFPYLSRIISFDMFSKLVDESLDKFKNMLNDNNDLQKYIGG